MFEAEVEIEIPFHDVDVMRVAWHGHYAKYLEIARCALLETFDYNCPQMEESGYAWPIIDMRIRYAYPLRFQQRVKVKAVLTEWEDRLKINYLISDAETGKRLTRAYTVQVAVDASSQEMLYTSPDILLQKLGVKP
jgi:acyl-CoA thioester hydrolase